MDCYRYLVREKSKVIRAQSMQLVYSAAVLVVEDYVCGMLLCNPDYAPNISVELSIS